ncbi:YlbD family protein [Bacillus sp. FJAT-29790]|uniref:YlbD family protein n=1 Tax=Bacillus sp. FJAT-29790 TaxID=1895002 RepID=UPI001C23F72B|nr:YlbD family protein [Bacillus sp. FJAT-29790]MBU8877692.1 YlbD family protein [Bacillus sp. FJAT-29790]
MTKKKLHPSVGKFKEFVKANPKLVQEVREGKHTWQELFEDWYLLGEDDSRWDSFRTETKDKVEPAPQEKNTDWMTNIMGSLKKMDSNQMQGHMNNISKALSAVQGVLAQFSGGSQVSPPKSGIQKPVNPFVFKKD